MPRAVSDGRGLGGVREVGHSVAFDGTNRWALLPLTAIASLLDHSATRTLRLVARVSRYDRASRLLRAIGPSALWDASTIVTALAKTAPGERIAGRFEIIDRIGRGAAGSVYSVVDRATGKQMALKRLQRRGDAHRDDLLRFRLEFQTLARLRHPRVVEVYEYGVDDAGPYYTMELLGGEDFRFKAPAPPIEACKLLCDVASALVFLHSRGMLHRDVASRNVRCASDGHAKLIDFGALSTMGYATSLVGTPPFIAPEALGRLPLDQRCDLFSLGALAYWLLTERHAFPARRIEDLLELWKTPPPPPSAHRRDIPPELDAVVLSMLSTNPVARPASAAEVMERLGAVAGLEPAGDLEAAHAYIQSAPLIGREREMRKLRRRLELSVQAGRGRAVLIEANSGSGKSRLLREIAVEAQLIGAVVLDATGSAVRGSAYELARKLVRGLLAAVPEVSKQALHPRAPVLARVFPEVMDAFTRVRTAAAFSDPREEHARIQSEFVSWLVEVAADYPLVILIDDLEYADEGSAALMVSLAEALRGRRMMLVATLGAEHAVRPTSAVAALRDRCWRLELPGLEADHVRRLVTALFGEIRHASRLASWIHGLAGGSPMLCTELARHLVDRGVLRYVDGLWLVPDSVEVSDLPSRLIEAMESRVSALSAEARSLAEVLSVHGGDFAVEVCVSLAHSSDHDFVLGAVHELVQAEVLVGSPEAFGFRYAGLRDAFLRNLSAERISALHLRVAEAIAENTPSDRDVEIGWHFLKGGDRVRAAPLLERGGRRLYAAHAFADAVSPLDAAYQIYNAAGQDQSSTLELGFELVAAAYMADPWVMLRNADRVIAGAQRASGLDGARSLESLIGTKAALAVGIGGATLTRWLRRPERRGPPPLEALRIFMMSVLYAMAAAVARNDVAKMAELVRALEPVAKLDDPLCRAVSLLAILFYDFMCGRTRETDEQAERVIQITQGIDVLDPLDLEIIQGASRAFAALVPAGDGNPSCLLDVERLEGSGIRVLEVVGLQTRLYYHLCRGEVDLVRRTQARQDVLALQLGTSWQVRAWSRATEAIAYGQTRDVIGLKRAIEELAPLVEDEVYAGYRPILEAARGEYLRERGQLAESIAAFERSVALLSSESIYREVTLAAFCDTLVLFGDFARAREFAEEIEAAARELKRHAASFRTGRALAMMDAAEGDLASSARRLDSLIEEAESIGNPATCGAIREARARVALLDSDHRAFETQLGRARDWFRKTGNPVFFSRYEQLAKSREPVPVASAAEPHAVGSISEVSRTHTA